eukprot:TRINITY_DN11689_c0_g1_i1.p1 TRINITY_DN11689_c0_g1~~TRINITY_DN11689_c0_g1_i1.p1  ORF type:complete len:719 (+),score=191.85 TRINITY_DN11689_c0_g1_i1:61-2217(+)
MLPRGAVRLCGFARKATSQQGREYNAGGGRPPPQHGRPRDGRDTHPSRQLRNEFVSQPNTMNKVRMVPDGWDEYDKFGTMVKSVRNGRLTYSVEQRHQNAPQRHPQRDDRRPQQGADRQRHDQRQQGASSYDRPGTPPSRPSASQPAAQPDADELSARDPWKPDENGQWYSATTKQAIDMDRYAVYPGEGKQVEEVLREMDAAKLMTWKPKRSRRTVVLLDSKWSGWHEVQWDGAIIKTIRVKTQPHPENPETLKNTPYEDEYAAIRAKIDEENREKHLADIAREEATAKHQPPKDDLDFDGKKLVSLVNSSDNMLVRAYTVFKFMERKNLVGTSVTFNSLLTACLNTCQFEMGLNVWRMMMRRGILPDQMAYNTLMNLSQRTGHRDYVFQIYDEMREFGLPPDRVTFHQLLLADTRRAHSLIQTCLDEGKHQVPDSVLLRMYCEQNVVDKAFALWDQLAGGRRPPSVEDYNVMLLLCERQNDYDRATQVFNHMEDRSVSPNFLTYNTVMNMMAINGDTEKLHKVQTMMHDRKVTTLVVLSTFKFAGKDTSIVNGVNMDLHVSIDVPTFDGEQDIGLSFLTQQMIQYLEHNTDYQVNLKGLPTYTLFHLGKEYIQRASLQFHCEKKSLAYLLMKHGRHPSALPPKSLPRINVNARMCMDCHDTFAAASKHFNVKLECNDNNVLHVFEKGEDLSLRETRGWRTMDAINVPGSGQFGNGL